MRSTAIAIGMTTLAATALAGCGNDIIAVKGKIADPAPEVGALHAVLGSHALDIAGLDTVPTTPNGDFSVAYSDGSIWHGNVNRSTGVFDATLDIPASFTTRIHDSGRLALSGGITGGATYVETFSYADGSLAIWSDEFTLSGQTLHLNAHQHGRDVTVLSDTTFHTYRVDFLETWDKPSTFHEDVQTSYYATATGSSMTQSWYRDDFVTDVSPDRSATFTLNDNGSGTGSLTWFYDHGISYVYGVTLSTNGSFDETVTFEDPGTQVSPDGTGSMHFNADLSGTGIYTEQYDGGSKLHVLQTFGASGSEILDYTFDDASTPFTPDLDGHQDIAADGSGNGDWNVHDAAGVTETCTYSFDSTGAVSGLSCRAPGATVPIALQHATRALRGAPAALLRERFHPPAR